MDWKELRKDARVEKALSVLGNWISRIRKEPGSRDLLNQVSFQALAGEEPLDLYEYALSSGDPVVLREERHRKLLRRSQVTESAMEYLLLVHSLGRWRATKGVYLFDPDLQEELSGTRLDRIPSDVLFHLPEPAPLVLLGKPYPFRVLDPTDESKSISILIHGFILTEGLSYYHNPPEKYSLVLLLLFTTLGEGGGLSVVPTSLVWRSGQTLEEGFRKSFEKPVDLPFFDGLSPNQKTRILESYVESQVQLHSLLLNLALYLAQERPDFGGVSPRTPRSVLPEGQKFHPSRLPDYPVVIPTGWRWGAAVRKARLVYQQQWQEASPDEEEALPSGKRVAPHVRRAHWHLYWTGKGSRKDPSKAIPRVRWVPATIVNAHLLLEAGFSLDDLASVAREVLPPKEEDEG